MRFARVLAFATLPLLLLGCAARQNDPLAHPSASPHASSQESTKAVAHIDQQADAAPTTTDQNPVNLLWFGPVGAGPNDNAAWQGALLAVEQANQAGGYKGRAFKLVPISTENATDNNLQKLTQLVTARDIFGLVGTPDRATAPLLTQAAHQARIPYINAATHHDHPLADDTARQFICTPAEDQLAQALAFGVAGRTVAGGRVAIVTGTALDARYFTNEVKAALQQLSLFPETEVYIHPHAAGFTGQIRRLELARPAAILVIASPEQSARFIKALHAESVDAKIFGGPALGTRTFLREAGEQADGVTFPLLWHTSQSDKAQTFTQQFINKYQQIPDFRAAHAYDAAQLLITGINDGGLDRDAIRQTVRRISPWFGVSGTITWSPTGHNERKVGLGTINAGRIEPLPQ